TTNPQSGNTGGVNITSARDVLVTPAGGGIGAHGNNNFTTTGRLTGTGPLTFTDVGGAGGRALNFNATGNDFTGTLIIFSNSMTLQVNSLGDAAGAGNIALNLGGNGTTPAFAYGAGATSPLKLDFRAFEVNAAAAVTATISNLNTTNALTVNTDLVATGAGAKTLTLSAFGGPTNVFKGRITNGTGGGTVGVTKAGAGTWTLSGDNSFSGGVTLSGASVGSQLNINSPTALGTGTFTISGGNNARLDNTSNGPITLTTNNPQAWTNDFAFVGSGALNLGTGAVTMGGTRAVTVTANTLTVGGPIAGAVATYGLIKSGNGTLALNGANTYTGTTTVSAGTLLVNGTGVTPQDNYSVTAAAGITATLGGSGGTVALAAGKTVTAGTRGVVAPGSGIATLNVAVDGTGTIGGVVFGSGGTFAVDAGPGPSSDRLNITGAGGNLDMSAAGDTLAITASSAGAFTIATYAGSRTGTFDLVTLNGISEPGSLSTFGSLVTFNATSGNLSVLYDDDAKNVRLNVVNIPEPTTVGAFGLAAVGLLARRRHRGRGRAWGGARQ
ncbi:MAG TPA: autotransporter-associated beta strand repeat-containing protein, partial [Humisphaera sp.]